MSSSSSDIYVITYNLINANANNLSFSMLQTANCFSFVYRYNHLTSFFFFFFFLFGDTQFSEQPLTGSSLIIVGLSTKMWQAVIKAIVSKRWVLNDWWSPCFTLTMTLHVIWWSEFWRINFSGGVNCEYF